VKRWIVRSGDGETVAQIVVRAGESSRAIDEGRVFVGKRRVTSGTQRVVVGDEVRIGRDSGADARAGFRHQHVVVFEVEEGIVAGIKPAGIPTVPDHAGSSHSFVHLVAGELGISDDQIRVVSRLDREVSGIILFATTAEAETRLKELRERGEYQRRYVAIAKSAASLRTSGIWDGPIGDGKDPRHRAVGGKDAKASTTKYRVVAEANGFVMLAVEPITGRTHQIRVHSAHAGAPLLGDRDYGGPTRVTLDNGGVVSLARIALHAIGVTLGKISGGADVPKELADVWRELGGDAEAWNTAQRCSFDASS